MEQPRLLELNLSKLVDPQVDAQFNDKIVELLENDLLDERSLFPMESEKQGSVLYVWYKINEGHNGDGTMLKHLLTCRQRNW